MKEVDSYLTCGSRPTRSSRLHVQIITFVTSTAARRSSGFRGARLTHERQLYSTAAQQERADHRQGHRPGCYITILSPVIHQGLTESVQLPDNAKPEQRYACEEASADRGAICRASQ